MPFNIWVVELQWLQSMCVGNYLYKGGLFQKFPIKYVTIFSNKLVVVAAR